MGAMRKFFLVLMVALGSCLTAGAQGLDVTHFMRISPFQHIDILKIITMRSLMQKPVRG